MTITKSRAKDMVRSRARKRAAQMEEKLAKARTHVIDNPTLYSIVPYGYNDIEILNTGSFRLEKMPVFYNGFQIGRMDLKPKKYKNQIARLFFYDNLSNIEMLTLRIALRKGRRKFVAKIEEDKIVITEVKKSRSKKAD